MKIRTVLHKSVICMQLRSDRGRLGVGLLKRLILLVRLEQTMKSDQFRAFTSYLRGKHFIVIIGI
jgi:hypothetical protein